MPTGRHPSPLRSEGKGEDGLLMEKGIIGIWELGIGI
jgi:hypothetical protein